MPVKVTFRSAILITSPGFARTTCSLLKRLSPTAPSMKITMPKCATHMPITSRGRRFNLALKSADLVGLSCSQISAPMPALSQPISPNATRGPMPKPASKDSNAMHAIAPPAMAQIITGCKRVVLPRRHAITGPIAMTNIKSAMTGLKVASK